MFKKLFFLIIIPALCLGNDVYKNEFKALKKSPDYKPVFDHEASLLLQKINQQIKNYKELGGGQRLTKFLIDDSDVVAISPDAMPRLCGYVNGLSVKHNIENPIIFVTTRKGWFNACALKVLHSRPVVILGQDFLLQTTDGEVEAVLAHELGHVKHNHVNKVLALGVSTTVAASAGIHYALGKLKMFTSKEPALNVLRMYSSVLLGSIVSGIAQALVIGKKFERQADEFAYRDAGQAEGLIKFLEHLDQKTDTFYKKYDQTIADIEKNKDALAPQDYNALKSAFWFARVERALVKARLWIAHHTPFDGHPSNQARIEAIKKYRVAQQS